MSQLPPTPLPNPEEFFMPEDGVVRASDRSFQSSASISRQLDKNQGFRSNLGLAGVARRTLGIVLLMFTVILWTTSNFLASYIFADSTYSKPYFVTYINTSFFAVSLMPICFRSVHQHGYYNFRRDVVEFCQGTLQYYRKGYGRANTSDNEDLSASTSGLLSDDGPARRHSDANELADAGIDGGALTVQETALLSLEFCLLWFIANYFVAACLEYTTVASSTILTSTSSIWTLIFGAVVRVERFSVKKLIGVLASLAGIMLISSIDLSGDNDENRGSFPHKSTEEIAIGDAMAFFSALMYGIYTVVMKKRIGNEDRVNMPLFFGFVGLFNVMLLWPGFFILHFTGVEKFALPPTGKIWVVVLSNSISSFVSDYCWAYAMLLTSPLVVTVGLSLSIPLSLVGQIILSSQYSSVLYWVGAFIVVLSFVFINHESKGDE